MSEGSDRRPLLTTAKIFSLGISFRQCGRPTWHFQQRNRERDPCVSCVTTSYFLLGYVLGLYPTFPFGIFVLTFSYYSSDMVL